MVNSTPSALAQTQASWLNSADGSWTDPSSWSNSPNYPNNGQPQPDDLYDVLIDAVGNAYTIRIDESDPFITVNSLTIDSPDATVFLDRNASNGNTGFTATNGIVINNGRLLLDVGRLVNTRISGTNGIIEVMRFGGNQPAIMDGVTLGVDTKIANNSSLVVNGVLTLDQATLTLEGAPNRSSLLGDNHTHTADLDIQGNGQIRMIGNTWIGSRIDQPTSIRSGIQLIAENNGGGNPAIINAGTHLLNEGMLSASGNDARLEIYAISFSNTGTVQAIDQGAIAFEFQNEVLTSDLGNLVFNNNGQFEFKAKINNENDTLSIGGAGDGRVFFSRIDSNNNSSIRGGIVETPNGTPIRMNRTDLHGITLSGTVAGTMSVFDGLEMNGGKIIIDQSSRFVVAGGQQITGNGLIELNGNIVGSLDVEFGLDATGPVELGAGITLHAISTADNIRVNQLVNNGTMLFDALGVVEGQLENRGLIHARDSLSLRGGGFNTPSVNVGTIEVDSGATLSIGDGFVNNGQIILRSDSNLIYTGTNSIRAFGTLVNEGVEEIEIRGTIDHEGETLDLDLVFGTERDFLDVHRAHFRNGGLGASVAGRASFNRGHTFEDIEFTSDVSFYGSSNALLIGAISIAQGKNLYLGLLPDGVTASVASDLEAHPTAPFGAVINGPGEIVVTGGATNAQDIEITSTTTALTIGPDQVIRTDGGKFTFSAINEGVIRVNNDADVLRLNNRFPGQFENKGLIEVNAGQLWIADNINSDNLGSVNVAPGAKVVVVGDFDLQGGTFDPADYGGQWSLLTGTLRNGRVETTDTPVLLNTQRSNNSNGGMLDQVTLAGTVRVENSDELRLVDGLVFDNGRIELGGDESYGRVWSMGNGSLLGTGEIRFTGTGTIPAIGVGNQLTLGSAGENVTIGPGIAIRSDGNDGNILHSAMSISNSGLISADKHFIHLAAQNDVHTFLNPDGILEAKNGGVLWIKRMTGDIGTLRISNGGIIRFGNDDIDPRQYAGDYRVSQDLTLNNNEEIHMFGISELGSILTVNAGARVLIGNTWTNTGELNLESGGVLEIDRLPSANGTLNLNGTVILSGLFTTPQVISLPLANAQVVVSTPGIIDNSTDTLTIGTDAAGLELRGGTIKGGIITSNSGEKLDVNDQDGSSHLLDIQNIQSDIELNSGDLHVDASLWTGQISANANTRLHLRGTAWNNTGGVAATDAAVTIADAPTQLGQFSLTRSVLNVDLAVTSASLQSAVSGDQSQISIHNSGSIDNNANTITLDQATLVWSLRGGKLTGGQVRAAGDEAFETEGGIIDGVEFLLPLEFSGPGLTELINNVQADSIVFSNNTGSAIAELGENQSLNGVDNITFTNGSSLSNTLRTQQSTFELPTGLTTRAEDGGQGQVGTGSVAVVHRGVLESDGTGSHLLAVGSTISNNGGTLRATNGGTLELDGLVGSVGTIEINNNGSLILNGTYQLDQTTTITQGALSLNGDWSSTAAIQLNDAILNWGTQPTAGKNQFQLANTTVQLETAATLDDLPASFAGNGNSLQLNNGGDIDLLGGSINTAVTPLTLNGGKVRNGQLSGPLNQPVQVLSDSRLDHVTLNTSVVIAPDIDLNIDNDLTNNGRISLNGGQLRASGLFTHSPGSFMLGHGTFRFNGRLDNSGTLSFDGGDTEVRGDISNLDGGSIVTLGGHTTTFFDAVTLADGSTVHTATDSTTVFFDLVQGMGTFTGAGTTRFARGLNKGNHPPATMTFEGNVELIDSPINRLVFEIAGTNPAEFDRLAVAGDLMLGGLPVIRLIEGFELGPTDEFVIIEVGGDLSGQFWRTEQDSLVGRFNGQDLFIDYAAGDGNDVALYTVPEPSSLALLGLGGLLASSRRKQCASIGNLRRIVP